MFATPIQTRLVLCTVSRARRGLGAAEVMVLLGIASFVILCVLIVLPRGRETARMAGCQRNLMQIGMGVQLYEQTNRRYPSSPGLMSPEGNSPILTMLSVLALPDFLELRDSSKAPKPTAPPQLRTRIPGLTCPSDPQASMRAFATALSYRANAGDDFAGTNGPLAPGARIDLATVESGDGASFTAGLAERLVGTGQDGVIHPANYRLSPNPIAQPCDPLAGGLTAWRGDAGSSWAESGWRSALYSHAITPNSSVSCLAADGGTAAITASSAHPGRINVWMLDGSIRGITPTVNPAVWRVLGGYRSVDLTPPPTP